MKVTAHLRYLRIAPRKVRLVADLIRGKSVKEARNILNFCRKKAALPLLKLLNSAVANAKHNFKMDEEKLFISEIYVNEGPRLKRIFPRAMGRADIIQKKMSHVSIFLEEMKENQNQKEKQNKK
jgi:large subunit ribosomal protein L22